MAGRSTEKALNFRGSSRRLLRTLAPQRPLITLALILGVASVTLTVLGPRLLGEATNVIFAGLVGRQIPAGLTQAEAVARLRHEGHGTLADLIGSLHLVPGQGIDFTAVAHLLLIVLVIYAARRGLRHPAGPGDHDDRAARGVQPARAGRRPSCPGCRCATSTGSRAARSSAGSPTTSTTWRSRCSRR